MATVHLSIWLDGELIADRRLTLEQMYQVQAALNLGAWRDDGGHPAFRRDGLVIEVWDHVLGELRWLAPPLRAVA